MGRLRGRPDDPEVWACDGPEETDRVARFLEALYAYFGFNRIARVGARFWEIFVIGPDTGRAAVRILVLEEPDSWVVAELAVTPLDPDETVTLITTHTASHTGSSVLRPAATPVSGRGSGTSRCSHSRRRPDRGRPSL